MINGIARDFEPIIPLSVLGFDSNVYTRDAIVDTALAVGERGRYAASVLGEGVTTQSSAGVEIT